VPSSTNFKAIAWALLRARARARERERERERERARERERERERRRKRSKRRCINSCPLACSPGAPWPACCA
jgi:hypothetical protein